MMIPASGVASRFSGTTGMTFFTMSYGLLTSMFGELSFARDAPLQQQESLNDDSKILKWRVAFLERQKLRSLSLAMIY